MGFTLDWQYSKGYVDISMPTFLSNTFSRLNYKTDKYPQYSPHEFHQTRWTNAGERQFATQEDTSPYLSPKDTKYIQSAVGALLYYARAIDPTMLPALNQIGTQQATPTQK